MSLLNICPALCASWALLSKHSQSTRRRREELFREMAEKEQSVQQTETEETEIIPVKFHDDVELTTPLNEEVFMSEENTPKLNSLASSRSFKPCPSGSGFIASPGSPHSRAAFSYLAALIAEKQQESISVVQEEPQIEKSIGRAVKEIRHDCSPHLRRKNCKGKGKPTRRQEAKGIRSVSVRLTSVSIDGVVL